MFIYILCFWVFFSVTLSADKDDYWKEPYDSETKSVVEDTIKLTVALENYYTKDEFLSVLYKTYKSYFHLNPHKVRMLIYLKSTNCTKNTTCRPKPMKDIGGCCTFQPDAIAKFKQCEIIVDTGKDPTNKANVEKEVCLNTTKANSDKLMYSDKTDIAKYVSINFIRCVIFQLERNDFKFD